MYEKRSDSSRSMADSSMSARMLFFLFDSELIARVMNARIAQMPLRNSIMSSWFCLKNSMIKSPPLKPDWYLI